MELEKSKKKLVKKSEKEINEEKKVLVKALVLNNIDKKIKEEEFLSLPRSDRKRIETQRKKEEEAEQLKGNVKEGLLK